MKPRSANTLPLLRVIAFALPLLALDLAMTGKYSRTAIRRNKVTKSSTKLTASWLNALATALIAAGGFAPAAAWIYGLSALPIGAFDLSAIALACTGVGIGLHVSALAVLGRLRE